MADHRLRTAARRYAQTQSSEDWDALHAELRRAGQAEPTDIADGVVGTFASSLADESDVADLIAETNAGGFHADDWHVRECKPITNGEFEFVVDIHLSGDTHDDMPWAGEEIQTQVKVTAQWTDGGWEVLDREVVDANVLLADEGDQYEPDTSYYDAEDAWRVISRAWVEEAATYVPACSQGLTCWLCGGLPIVHGEDCWTGQSPVLVAGPRLMDQQQFDEWAADRPSGEIADFLIAQLGIEATERAVEIRGVLSTDALAAHHYCLMDVLDDGGDAPGPFDDVIDF